ncbi:MAG: type II toxin-antitoxin system VapC family toxin [Thiocapsa sp.]|uniref:type II toxin-antitoxin system VapC family toxin n=1 Tax=Thiocapsa sp. TaxID=2024551 RepID=UPI001BCCE7CE|nr:MAG: type II toxin-antitoxin system VapC family toxin [Thiocapsa sp.]
MLALFARLNSGGLTLIPVSRTAYRTAANLVDDSRQGLRGADALHIAVAREIGLQRFATLDRNQSANAGRLGLTLEFPDPHGWSNRSAMASGRKGFSSMRGWPAPDWVKRGMPTEPICSASSTS